MLLELAASVHRALVLVGTIYLVFAIAIALMFCIAIFFLGRMFVEFIQVRGRRYILCPETGSVALIRIDAIHAAISSVVDDPELQVDDCSRWPEHKDCAQRCLLRIE